MLVGEYGYPSGGEEPEIEEWLMSEFGVEVNHTYLRAAFHNPIWWVSALNISPPMRWKGGPYQELYWELDKDYNKLGGFLDENFLKDYYTFDNFDNPGVLLDLSQEYSMPEFYYKYNKTVYFDWSINNEFYFPIPAFVPFIPENWTSIYHGYLVNHTIQLIGEPNKGYIESTVIYREASSRSPVDMVGMGNGKEFYIWAHDPRYNVVELHATDHWADPQTGEPPQTLTIGFNLTVDTAIDYYTVEWWNTRNESDMIIPGYTRTNVEPENGILGIGYVPGSQAQCPPFQKDIGIKIYPTL